MTAEVSATDLRPNSTKVFLLLHVAQHEHGGGERQQDGHEQRVVEVGGQQVERLRGQHSIQVDVGRPAAEGEHQATGLELGGAADDVGGAALQRIVVREGAHWRQRQKG